MGVREDYILADVIGDGITDDTDRLQYAIDIAISLGLYRVKIRKNLKILLSKIVLPKNNITIFSNASYSDRPIFKHLLTEGDMFYLDSPSGQTHTIIFENVQFIAHPLATTSRGLYVDTSTYTPFKVSRKNCYFEGFAVGAHVEECFWSYIEGEQYYNNKVGYYGGAGVANIIVNCEPRGIPENGIGMWLLGSKTLVIGGDTATAASGNNSVLYRIGNDTSATGYSGITASQKTTSVNFVNTHFEFSNMLGLGTVQSAFIEVRDGSTIDVDNGHFMCRTPNMPNAIVYNYLINTSNIKNCRFDIGPSNADPLINGNYTNHINIISKSTTGTLNITPTTFGDLLKITGITVSTGLNYNVQSGISVDSGVVLTIAAGATTQLTYNVEKYDIGGEYASNQFVATYPGIYEVKIPTGLGGTNPPVDTARYRLELRKNGAAIRRFDYCASGVGNQTIPFSSQELLESGDILTIFLNNTSNSPIDIGNNSTTMSFQVKKVN